MIVIIEGCGDLYFSKTRIGTKKVFSRKVIEIMRTFFQLLRSTVQRSSAFYGVLKKRKKEGKEKGGREKYMRKRKKTERKW